MANTGVPQPGGSNVSIRAQAKKDKAAAKAGPGQSSSTADKATANKPVTKATLASPLTVPWPNIPRHLQTTVVNALPQLVTPDVADYHVSRQRCHRSEKKQVRKESRRDKAAAVKDNDQDDASSGDVTMTTGAGESSSLSTAPGSSTVPNAQSKAPRAPRPVAGPAPFPPEILAHLVLGTNEIIKALERQTDDLRLRIMMIGDALNAQIKPKNPVETGKGKRKRDDDEGNTGRGAKVAHVVDQLGSQRFLPTAPLADETDAEEEADANASAAQVPVPQSDQRQQQAVAAAEPATASGSAGVSNTVRDRQPSSPLQYILIPLPDINPPSLVSPIPAYCATYNTFAYQHDHLLKIARTRLPQPVLAALQQDAHPVEEVRVVPLGRVEAEMAAMAGLRRMACLGIKSSHPQIKVLQMLLPKSVLHPPRHSLTLPFPIPVLTVHNDGAEGNGPARTVRSAKLATAKPAKSTKKAAAAKQPAVQPSATTALLPHIHYAPLHVKGITTTVPADGASRKAKRLEQVRQKRRDNKEARKVARQEMEEGIMKGLKRKALGLKGMPKRTKPSKKTVTPAEPGRPAGNAIPRK